MNNSIKLLFLLVLLQIFITGCSKTDDDELNTAIVSADSTAAASVPVISEVTAAASPTSVNTPNYIFSSSEAGTITYGGSCSSSTTSAAVDNNKITFNVLADGIYSNCTISVTDSASNTSNILSVSSFTVDATAPTLSEVKEVSTSTSDDTSSYTFSSTEAGTITYGGSCTSSTTSASAANNTITFNALADGTYSNCTIIVTDSVGNSSNFLTITSFTVAIQSTIEEVTAILTPNNDSTPNYTFSSTEAGTITYGGSCSSSDTTVISGNNTITLNALADGTYSNCTITVTNTEGEAGDPITITSFVVDSAMETGTINGSVLGDYTNSSLSGVSVSYANSGITMGNIITDSSGDFSQTLILGTYTLTYNMSGYLDVIQSATLETDNQTLVVSTLRMLSDTCSSGTISGTIKDAVSNNSVTGVSLNVRSGVNVTSGTILKTDVTSNTGTYSLSSMSAG